MHSQLNAVFNAYPAGITTYYLSLGYYQPVYNTESYKSETERIFRFKEIRGTDWLVNQIVIRYNSNASANSVFTCTPLTLASDRIISSWRLLR